MRVRAPKKSVLAMVVGLLLVSGIAGAERSVVRRVGVPELTPPPGKIVYVRRLAAKRTDPFATRTDGSATRRLTQTPEQELEPTVSPDGQRIAFSRRIPGTFGGNDRSEIWVSGASGSAPHRVTRGGADASPTWSRDGSMLLFSRHRFDARGDSAEAIFSIRIAPDAGATRVTNPPFGDWPSCVFDLTPWPGRSVVAFAHSGDCAHGFSADIYAVDYLGRNVPILSNLRLDADVLASPAFSPDGRTLAFAALRTGNPTAAEGIYLAAPDGSEVRRLTADGTSPAWSRDGTWIAFIRAGDVWIVRPDRTGARRITSTPQDEDSPEWLP